MMFKTTYHQLHTVKLRDIFILSITNVIMIAMFGSENIVEAFSEQYTCYTFNTHFFMYLHSNTTYQLGDKSSLWFLSTIKSRPTICKSCYFAQT